MRRGHALSHVRLGHPHAARRRAAGGSGTPRAAPRAGPPALAVDCLSPEVRGAARPHRRIMNFVMSQQHEPPISTEAPSVAERAANLPAQPGVYLMKDGAGRVLY